jgi:hypothetical protein
MLNNIANDILSEAYKQSIEYELEEEFIKILEEELLKRGIKFFVLKEKGIVNRVNCKI